jgi:hypothetical protein
MVGKVISVEFQEAPVAGSVVVLMDPDYTAPIGICTVMHMTSAGNFYLEGKEFSGEVEDVSRLRLLGVVRSTDKSYEVFPLKFNQWEKSIRNKEVNNPLKPVDFTLTFPPFFKGNYRRECVECSGDFIGDKRQPLCEECCRRNPIAKIILTKTKSKFPDKPKAPKTINVNLVELLCREAYKLGHEGKPYRIFEQRLKISLQNYGTDKSDNQSA